MYKLYFKSSCPFCQKVIGFAEERSINFEKIDVTDPENLEELIKLGGKKMVPFLVDTSENVMMYESSDIINYLDKKSS